MRLCAPLLLLLTIPLACAGAGSSGGATSEGGSAGATTSDAGASDAAGAAGDTSSGGATASSGGRDTSSGGATPSEGGAIGEGGDANAGESSGGSNAGSPGDARADVVEACVSRAVRENESVLDTGVAVAVVEDGSVLLTAGYGLRDRERGLPVDVNTLFAIGSSTKAFTATLTAMLVDDGIASFDTPISEALPAFVTADPEVTAATTAIDLMAHRTGLERHDLMWSAARFTREELLDRLRFLDDDDVHEFRASIVYNNLMYLSAGLWLEALAGAPWEDLLEERIFAPLGMTDSVATDEALALAENVALPYRFELPLDRLSLSVIGPAGSIHSTATDMAAWLAFQVNGGVDAAGERLVSTESLEVTYAAHYPVAEWHYALGWSVGPLDGYRVISHGGSLPGFLSSVTVLPELGAGVAVMVNNSKDPLVSYVVEAALECLLSSPAYEPELAEEVLSYVRDLRAPTDVSTPSLEPRDPNEEEVVLSLEASLASATFQHAGYGDMTIHDLGNEVYAVEYFDQVWPASYLGGVDVLVAIWADGRYVYVPLTYVLEGTDVVAFDLPLASLTAPSRFVRID